MSPAPLVVCPACHVRCPFTDPSCWRCGRSFGPVPPPPSSVGGPPNGLESRSERTSRVRVRLEADRPRAGFVSGIRCALEKGTDVGPFVRIAGRVVGGPLPTRGNVPLGTLTSIASGLAIVCVTSVALFVLFPIVTIGFFQPRLAGLLTELLLAPLRVRSRSDRETGISFRLETPHGQRQVRLPGVEHTVALGDEVEVLGEVRRGEVFALLLKNNTTGVTRYAPAVFLLLSAAIAIAVTLVFALAGHA